MRIKHYTLIVAFLAISMGIPLVQGCSDPFDEYQSCHHEEKQFKE